MTEPDQVKNSTSVNVGGNVGGHVVVGDNNTSTSDAPKCKNSDPWWVKIITIVMEFFKGK